MSTDPHADRDHEHDDAQPDDESLDTLGTLDDLLDENDIPSFLRPALFANRSEKAEASYIPPLENDEPDDDDSGQPWSRSLADQPTDAALPVLPAEDFEPAPETVQVSLPLPTEFAIPSQQPAEPGVPTPQEFPAFPTGQDVRRITGQMPPARPATNGGCTLPVLGVGVIVLSLVILALFLPPISLWNVIDEAINGEDEKKPSVEEQLAGQGLAFHDLSAESPGIAVDGLQIQAAPDALTGSFGVNVIAASPADYLAGRTPDTGWFCDVDLPPNHALASPVYSLLQRGTAPDQLTVQLTALPEAEAAGSLALYTWNATVGAWEFLPAQAGATPGTLSAQVPYLPRCIAVFRGTESARLVSVTLAPSETFDSGVLAANARVYPAGLHPTLDGALQGVLPPGFETGQGYAVMPLIQNFEDPAVIDAVTVGRILENTSVRTQHARQIAAFVLREGSGYAGVVIDYRDVPPDLRDAYSAFITDLADLLHSANLTLAVVVPAPTYDGAAGTWQTGAYDWHAIGRAADEVAITLPLDPAAYAAGGVVEQLLDWAATQISQSKLHLSISALCVEDQGGGMFAPVGLGTALGYLGGLQLTPSDSVQPGETVTAELANPYGVWPRFERDEALQTSYVHYDDANGQTVRTMWLTDAAALSYRLHIAAAYNLGGVIVRDLMAPGTAPGLDGALLAYRLGEAGDFEPFDLMLAWTAREGDTVIQQEAGLPSDPFTVTAQEGQQGFVIEAAINGTPVGSQAITVAALPTPTPVPTATPEAAQPEAEQPEAAAPETTQPEAEQPEAAAPVVDAAAIPRGDVGTQFEAGTHAAKLDATSIKATGRAHFKWIALDVLFTPGAQAADQQRYIDDAQANGFKILLSVSGNPGDMAASDFATYITEYAAYVGSLASLGVDGIEVWREPNSATAWPSGQIKPGRYIKLLSLSYAAIKSANPNTLVISGALLPSVSVEGSGQSDDLWNDDVFYTGLAKVNADQFADCIGVEYLQGTVPPDATSGDPRGDAPIYYLSTLTERASSVFGGALPVCFTRIGYLSPEGFPALPEGYEWAQATTAAQQGQWLAAALAPNLGTSGSIRLMIVYTVAGTALDEFDVSGGYAIIRPDQSCPACEAITPLLETQ